MQSHLAVIDCLEKQIAIVAARIDSRIKLRPEFKSLLSVSGIGKILALTIMLERGEIGRFEKVGNFASYCPPISYIPKCRIFIIQDVTPMFFPIIIIVWGLPVTCIILW